MISRLRHRVCRHPWLFCLLLVLTFLIRPMLAHAADIHSFSHGQASAQGEMHSKDHHNHHLEHSDTSDEAQSLLHQVMHSAHCCGQTSALVYCVNANLSYLPALAPPTLAASDLASPPRQPDLRPPI